MTQQQGPSDPAEGNSVMAQTLVASKWLVRTQGKDLWSGSVNCITELSLLLFNTYLVLPPTM